MFKHDQAQLQKLTYEPHSLPGDARTRLEDSADDAEIVKSAMILLQNRGYEELRILTCEYHEGMLILKGRVSSFYLKQLAQVTVRAIDDVQFVLNTIDVDSNSQ